MKNQYFNAGEYVWIIINHKGKQLQTMIDKADLHIAQSYDGMWHMNGGYVSGYIKITKGRKGKKRMIRLHRLIVDAPESKEVDHINRDKLCNTRSNLRIVTHEENLQNKSFYQNNTSGVRGISFRASHNKWRAYTSIGNGKQKHLGYYDTAEEATAALENYMAKGQG